VGKQGFDVEAVGHGIEGVCDLVDEAVGTLVGNFPGDELAQVDRWGLTGKVAYLDEGAAATGGAEEAVDGGRGAGAVVGDGDVRGEAVAGGVDEVVGTHVTGVVAREIGKVSGVHLKGTVVLGDTDEEGADGTAAIDKDRLVLEVGAEQAVDGDAEGFGGGGAGGHTLRNGADLVLTDHAIRRKAPLLVRIERS